MKDCTAGVPSGRRLRDLGLINWVIARIGAKSVGAEQMHLFNVLGNNRRLFWAWLPFSGILLGGGKLPKRDTELVILRVGYLRGCTYELQHHSEIAERRGLSFTQRRQIAEGPRPKGVSHEDILMRIVDELVVKGTLSTVNRKWLAYTYNPAQMIEFVMLTTQYNGLATLISALQIPEDFDED